MNRRQFKLTKTYPGSPPENTIREYAWTGSLNAPPYLASQREFRECITFPEFWQEIDVATPTVILTTQDGVAITDPEQPVYWLQCMHNWQRDKWVARQCFTKDWSGEEQPKKRLTDPNYKAFSTVEALEVYEYWNRPRVSYTVINGLLERFNPDLIRDQLQQLIHA
ncbi:hypothetical protein GCM10028806_33830 [Spirosoma terrae]|uniref:Uncharacterized protein n=1 Tax=Spirosoma terrae TaxID=1968276 RepID=A0A6L9L4Z8_9BACT|nr:hypothetical protein [Spirosoma terrae]NDU95695.1 hypothetical protein [Spirosoma terrae]